MIGRALAVGALLLSANTARAEPPPERDWAQALRVDAQTVHDEVAANHPGPFNPDDPGFAARNDAQLAIALDRARTAASYSDYFYALRQYVSSFDDGHMSFGAGGDTPNDFRWPGLATRYDGSGAIVVGAVDADAPVPVGARLTGCDGLSAADYATATVGKMWGRWNLESQQQQFGWLLFLDEGSRYIPQAKSCTFRVDGAERTVALTWRPLSMDRLHSIIAQLVPDTRPEFADRTLADGTRWFSLPSFDGDPASPAGKELVRVIGDMKARRDVLAAAPTIVFDLRGNGGGSSDWSLQMANVLWGPAAVAARSQTKMQIDWRASPGNLASIEQAYDKRRGGEGFAQEVDRYFRSTIAGLKSAIAAGQPLWRADDDGEDASPEGRGAEAPAPLAGPVHVLTDATCMSACLDAVDLWTAMGAIQVGRTTGADTNYMEVRSRSLPSGLTGFSIPMKVYHGRPRGSNEPAVPRHVYAGDIGDTAKVEQWIAGLPEQTERTK